jgi:hypothetical protein
MEHSMRRRFDSFRRFGIRRKSRRGGRRSTGEARMARRPMFDKLEPRTMLAILSVTVQEPFVSEDMGPAATFGEVYRYDSDLSQPLTVALTSSDESEVVVPPSVTIPANETTVAFPIDIIDDTLLDGEQVVFIAATDGFDTGEGVIFVQDVETATVTFDQSVLSPGDTLTGTVTVSVAGNSDPVSVPIDSTRPGEIASIVVVVPVGQQTVDFEIPVTSDAVAEGPHAVRLNVSYEIGFYGNTEFLSVSDPGVNTFQPSVDGHARDADKDGNIFEQLTLDSTVVTTQAAKPTDWFGEARGIVEFDVSTIPSGAVIQSAVLTLDIGGASYSPGNDLVINVFAYAGNGLVESSDANETGNHIGQMVLETDSNNILRSYPLLLDIADVQSLIGSNSHLGIVTAMQASQLSFYSSELFREFSRPSLHLVWSAPSGPVITANSLAIEEGGTVVLDSSDLAASDSDSDDASLVFMVADVSRGQFLVSAVPAVSFTQADIAAGLVSFAHDGSEFAPSYDVTVSDGTLSFGPQSPAVTFTNVNDNPPAIGPSQVFEVNEHSAAGIVIGSVSFGDIDAPGDSFSLAIIGGNGAGIFAIDNNGVLEVADPTALDSETANSHTLTISLFDGIHTTTGNVTVNVIDGADIVPILTLDAGELLESFGPAATLGRVARDSGDLSQPLTVMLTSSDETELTVPASVVIPAFETDVIFPVDVVDDTLLDGNHVVTITALAVGGEATSVEVTIYDVEMVTVTFDQLAGSPGDTLNATVAVTNTDRSAPLTIVFDSTRPDEIAPMPVTIPANEQSVVVPITVMADAFTEGAHTVQITVSAEGYIRNSEWLAISDPGVDTILPDADGRARDADQDGNVFEDVATHFHEIVVQTAAANGSFGETRGIVEFDTSTIPAGAIIESAVLSVDVSGTAHFPGNDIVMDVFGYEGNGVVESSDANETANHLGRLTIETDNGSTLGSAPISLDVARLQSLVDGGGQVGLLAKMQISTLQFHSKEFFRTASRPALHLVLAYPPVLTANTLSLNEGETKILTSSNIAATDADSDGGTLMFTVSNVSGGQFLVAGSPAMSFTQSQIAAGQVAFAHDGGEFAPAFRVSVSDGVYSDGPHTASINFSNVNDNAPTMLTGQVFTVSEGVFTGTPLGQVAFTDSDLPGDSFVLSIVGGNGAEIFAIDNAGNLSIADETHLDFESIASHALTIRVFDGTNTSDQVVTVNVLDVDETKFYVVDDGTSDRTYEYEATGAAAENYALASGNAAPRGAASTATGDRVWVVDDSGTVFVYDNSGGLLGSWTAGSMSSNASPEGIATDGSDVWIVDAKSDKVFRYAGAASRLSGSQSAASSFNLNSGNRAPKGIETDGSSLWVVNNSSNDRVFKYTTAGTLLGSWAIDAANSQPTGITIDPANVSDIWIVDSGTDRVYQYPAAAVRTSGSQSAATSFALSAGNSNPQGIADPPTNVMAPGASPTNDATPNNAVNLEDAAHRSAAWTPEVTRGPSRDRFGARMAREQAFASFVPERFDLLTTLAKRPVEAMEAAQKPARFTESEQSIIDFAFELTGRFAALLGNDI